MAETTWERSSVASSSFRADSEAFRACSSNPEGSDELLERIVASTGDFESDNPAEIWQGGSP